MFALSLLSGGLFALPVLLTVGIFIGAEYQALFLGKGDVSSGWFGGGGGGGSGGSGGSGRRFTTETYCQKAYGITPFPGRYVFNPNQWGDENDTGDLCMNITTDKGVSDKEQFAAPFTATWTYPQGPEEEPVHAFPNAQVVQNDTLPVLMSDVKSLWLDVKWTYGLGNDVHNSTDNGALDTANLNANVAVDMFASEDKEKAFNTTAADYEVMVWLGRWGPATQPIGFLVGSQATEVINKTTFNLFYGENGNKQRVFTWVADQNTTTFAGDLSPLVTTLSPKSGPSASSYVGYIAFGSEALYCVQNVTFAVPRLELEVFT